MENNSNFPPYPPNPFNPDLPPYSNIPTIPTVPVQPPPEPFFNRFIQAGREGLNDWWRYLLGILLTFGVGYSLIGALPILVIVFRGMANHYFSLEEAQAKPNNLESPAFLHVDANVLLPCLLFIFVAAMFFLWIAVRFIHKKRFLSVINYEGNRFDFKRFFVGAGIWFLMSVIFFALSYFSDPKNFQLVFEPGPFIITVIICLLMLPLQTGWEEVFLRGYLMQGLGLWLKKPFWPLIITSVTFGLLHMENAEVSANGVAVMLPQYIMPGLIFGLITLLDERLELAMGLHFANNFFGIITVTSPDMSIQAHAIWRVASIGGPMDVITGSVPLLLVLGILWWKYRWNAQKLYRVY